MTEPTGSETPAQEAGMTPAHRRQLAERLVRKHVSAPSFEAGSACRKLRDEIESALSSAYRAGQIAALKEAAEAYSKSRQTKMLNRQVCEWLRARASQVEEGEGT